MAINYFLDVGHAAVAELYGVPVENFLSLWPAGKDLSMRLMNARPMLVLTLLLYGGLNHITLLCRLHFCDGGCCGGGLNSSLKA